ncbi:hypothetical protein AAMO2058_001185800 [Amorphochlora amoebiformis]
MYTQALGAMYDVKSGLFPTAISQNHRFSHAFRIIMSTCAKSVLMRVRFQGVSSESLHMLAYLDPEDLPPHKPGTTYHPSTTQIEYD